MEDAAERLYERVLVLRSQAGDPLAFAELVERYARRLDFYLRKLLPRPDVADDVLQDVWLDAFRGLPRLRDPAALSAWLYRLARDRAFRHWRRQREYQPLPNGDIVDRAALEEEFSADDTARVNAGLDRLPAEQREVLVLRFVEQMSYEDMARVVGCPVGTVRSRLYHAKRALRRLLEEGKS